MREESAQQKHWSMHFPKRHGNQGTIKLLEIKAINPLT